MRLNIKKPGNKFLFFTVNILLILINLVSLIKPGAVWGETVKEIWFLFNIGILLALNVLVVLSGRVRVISFNMTDLLVTAYFIYTFVNSCFKTSYLPALYHTNVITCGLVCMYFVIRMLAGARLITFSGLSLSIYSLLTLNLAQAFLQYFEIISSAHTLFPITGGFFNPGPFAVYVAACSSFLIASYYYSVTKVRTGIPAPIQLLSIAGAGILILICFSRAAWISIIVTATLMILTIKWDFFSDRFKTLRYKSVYLLAVLIIPIAVSVWMFNLKKESAIGRGLTWQVSLAMFKDYSLTGIGTNNFPVKYAGYQYNFLNTHPGRYDTIAGDVRSAFNDFLQLLCEEGIIGTFLFAGILLTIAASLRNRLLLFSKKENLMPIACTGSLISILISGLVSYPLSLLSFKIYFWILVAVIAAFSKETFTISLKGRFITLFALTFIFSSLFFIHYSTQRWLAYRQVESLKSIQSNHLIKAGATLADHPYFLLLLGRSYMNEGAALKAINSFENAKKVSPDKEIYYELGTAWMAMENYRLAERYFRFIYIAQPSLLTPKYLLAKLYYKSSDNFRWIAMAKTVVCAKPKNPSFNTVYMQQEISKLLLLPKR